MHGVNPLRFEVAVVAIVAEPGKIAWGSGLWNDNAEVQSDCVKVLYEVGALEPRLIAGYADDFLKLLGSKNNRLVWGGTPALAAQVQV